MRCPQCERSAPQDEGGRGQAWAHGDTQIDQTGTAPILRSYSMSGPPDATTYRVSVKLSTGIGSSFFHHNVRVGDLLQVSAPRGGFTLGPGNSPVVLLSAGIGATPVLAMLHALASARSTRHVLWLHAARDREHHPFAAEVHRLMLAIPHGRSYVCYSRPGSLDKLGEDFDAAGRFSRWVFGEAGLPREALLPLERGA